jgi:hypothetical protein
MSAHMPPFMTSRPRVGLVTAAVAVVLACLPAAPASAGRLLLTGPDPDHHCGRHDDGATGQCHFFRVAVNYVRGAGATKPVLVLDRPWDGNPATVPDIVKALDRAFVPGAVPRVVVDPRNAFRTTPFSAQDYSAILIGASKDETVDLTPQDLNELNSRPDMDAINARAADLRAFFDNGGGIFVSSGGRFARGDSASFYKFLPITLGGTGTEGPYSLTELGRRIGFTDGTAGTPDDVNCCFTHLSFQPPAPESPLDIAEQDMKGLAETLVADAARLSDLNEPGLNPETIFKPIPRSTRAGCRNRARVRISLRRPRRVRFARVVVYVNGRRVKRVGARRLGARRYTRPFVIRLRRGRTSRVRIVAVTTTGKRVIAKRRYKICA